MSHFSCNSTGRCELDPRGEYEDEEQCTAQCQGMENKEVQLMTYQYNLAAAAQELSPSDQALLVKRETGVNVSLQDAYDILLSLDTEDWQILAQYKEMVPWIREQRPGPITFDITR